VKLPEPSAVCAEKGASDDAPAHGYPVGSTVVHYQGTKEKGCETRVTVTDEVAPVLTCSGLPVVVLPSPGASVASPLPTAKDVCSSKVTLTASPAKLDTRGSVPVTYTATDASGNKSVCNEKITVRNGFAVELRLAHAAIVTSGTAAVVLWDTPPGSDADEYRVERASSTSGPWKALGTVPVGTTSWSDPDLGGLAAFYRVVTQVKGVDGGTSPPLRVLAVTASEYDLGVQPIPGFDMPADAPSGSPETMSAPIIGYVRYPTKLSDGPYPVALLLHGNHGNCRPPDWDSTGTVGPDDACFISNDNTCPSGYTPTPNAQGLLSLAETLAAHGYVVSSVDANAVNCRQQSLYGREDGFIGQRTELLIEHLRRWRTWSTTGAAPFGSLFAGEVDMAHAVLFGHSRGAEAVAEVPQTFATATDVAGITLSSVFALAPTNFDDPQPGTLPFATLVPICDGDVYTYTGVQLYDRRLRQTGTRGPGVQFFMGHADHDHFNTEWVFDDDTIYVTSCDAGQLDTAAFQQRTLEVLVGTWLDEIVPPGAALEPFMHAVGAVPPSIASYAAGMFPLDLRRSYSSTSLTLVDSFEESASLGPDLLGGAYASMGGFADATPLVCSGVSTPACDAYYSAISTGWPHYNVFDSPPWRSAVALDWDSSSAVITANLAAGTGTFDASKYAALSLRVASRVAPTNTDGPGAPVDFEIALVDAGGHRGASLASAVTSVENLYASPYPRAVLQTVRLALPGLAAASSPAVDLHHLEQIEIATSATGQASGSILVTDVEFAQ
jgi:hypothetical protein